MHPAFSSLFSTIAITARGTEIAMSTTASSAPRSRAPPPAPLVLSDEGSPTETLATTAQWAVPPVMPDVFVVAPDGESSFCAFSSERSGPQNAPDGFFDDDELPPSPSAPDFAELDRALDFLQKGAEELSPRRRRAARRSATPPDDVLSWLHQIEDDEPADAQEEPEDLVKSRAPRPETPPPPADIEPSRPSTPSPSKGLRNKASLVFKRAFAAAAAKAQPPAEPVAPATQSAAHPIASTTELKQLEQLLKQHDAVPPEQPQPQAKPRRTKSRLFFNKLFSSSQNVAPAAPAADKSKSSKSSFLRRSKKTPKTSQPKENSPAAGLPSKAREAEDEPTLRPSPQPSIHGLRRRPFSSLALATFGSSNKSSVKFPPASRPLDSEAPPNSPTSSRNTTDSSATAVSSNSPYGDHETSSSASSSLTTLGNGPTLVHSTLPGFHSKRLDSLHFDSATFFDPTSYSFTTR